MALFSRKKAPAKKDGADKAPAAPARPAVAAVADRNLSSVIVKPRITEKAMQKSEQNVYTFIVRRDATKRDVAEAITALYNVTPVKVNIVNKAPRQSISRRLGRTVSEKGMKKAYVYLKKGDTISLM